MTPADDIPEIVAALDEFVAEPEPYILHFDTPLDLRIMAAEMRVLPAVLDWGGCFALRPSGEVVSFTWDKPQQLRVEPDERIRNLTYFQATLKYPRLASLVPQRPLNAVVCSYCHGSGRWGGGRLPDDLAKSIICNCGGLGWSPK